MGSSSNLCASDRLYVHRVLANVDEKLDDMCAHEEQEHPVRPPMDLHSPRRLRSARRAVICSIGSSIRVAS